MRNSLWGVRRRSQALELQRIAPNEVIYIVGLPAAPGPVSNGEVLSWRVNPEILLVSELSFPTTCVQRTAAQLAGQPQANSVTRAASAIDCRMRRRWGLH